MSAWIFIAILVGIHCSTLQTAPISNEMEVKHDRLTASTRRSLLYSRNINPYNERDYTIDNKHEFAAMNSFDTYDDEYYEQIYDDDDLFNVYLQQLEGDISSLIDLIEDEESAVIHKATTFHVLFARHPYTLQNKNILNSVRYDIAASEPIGRYQLESLRDHFLNAVKNGLTTDSIVYEKLLKSEYRLDMSPLRRAVLTGLMMAQSVFDHDLDNSHLTPKYGYVLDRRLQEYHPLACKHSRMIQCRVNLLRDKTLDLFKRVHNGYRYWIYSQKAKKAKNGDRNQVRNWLKYGFIDRKFEGQDRLWDVVPDSSGAFIHELMDGNVDISSMFDENGEIRNAMSAERSKKLLTEWVQNIGSAHDLGTKSDEPLVVVAGHSESLKDLMTGGTNVEIEEASRTAYDNAKCGDKHKVCNCQLVYFEVDLSRSDKVPEIKKFKSLWTPAATSKDYIEMKHWNVKASDLKTA